MMSRMKPFQTTMKRKRHALRPKPRRKVADAVVPVPRAPEADREGEHRQVEEEGLVVVDDTGIQVTSRGWFFVRAVAMLFDRYLQADRNRARFSRII